VQGGRQGETRDAASNDQDPFNVSHVVPPIVRIEQMVRASKAAEASFGLAMYGLQINAEKNPSISSRIFIPYPLRNRQHGVHANTFGIILVVDLIEEAW
jgi:hypothetical protein